MCVSRSRRCVVYIVKNDACETGHINGIELVQLLFHLRSFRIDDCSGTAAGPFTRSTDADGDVLLLMARALQPVGRSRRRRQPTRRRAHPPSPPVWRLARSLG
jgi:hypothetical protein